MPTTLARETVRDLNRIGGFARRAPIPRAPRSPTLRTGATNRQLVRSLNDSIPLTRGRTIRDPARAARVFRADRGRRIAERSFARSAARGAGLGRGRIPLPRLPRVPGGSLVRRGLPLLNTASLIYDGIGFLESQAPGVHRWLRGGWRGVSPLTITESVEEGQCQTIYRVGYDATLSEFGTFAGAINLMGPIHGTFLNPPEPTPDGGFRFGSAGIIHGPNFNRQNVTSGSVIEGLVAFSITETVRDDGLPDNCTVRREIGPGYDDRPTAPAQSRNPANSAPGTTQNPPVPTLTPPTSPGESGNRDPAQAPSPFPFPIPPPIPGRAPSPDSNPDRDRDRPEPFPDTGNCSGGCNQQLSDGQKFLDDKLNRQNDRIEELLNRLDAGAQAEQLRRLQVIDDKLGPQILGPTGAKIGIGGRLVSFAQSADRWFRRLGGDRALQLLTLGASLHNAAMLSNNLAQTMTQAISNVLASVGVKDADGQPFDIGQILGNRLEDFLVNAIGIENYTRLSSTWLRANRIMQAGANIVNSIQSIRMAIMSALENIGSMNARVGNALKRWGVVGDSAYPWFSPTPNYDNPFFQALENVEQFTSNVDQVASEVLSAQESVNQLGQQRQELRNAVSTAEEQPLPDNVQQFLRRQEEQAASVTPDINNEDFINPNQ